MKISFRDISIFCIADVNEDITDSNYKEFEQLLTDLINRPGRNVVINLCGVDQICEKAFPVFRQMWNSLVCSNGTINCISPNALVRGKLIENGLNVIMPLYESEGEFKDVIVRVAKTTRRIRVKKAGKYKIIDISQWYDTVSGYHNLDDKMNTLIKEKNKYVGLNLSSAQTVYSQLAGMIAHWSSYFKKTGGNFCLLGLNENLREQLLLMNFDKFVSFYDSVDELSSDADV